MSTTWVPAVNMTVKVRGELVTIVEITGTDIVLRTVVSNRMSTIGIVEFLTVVEQVHPVQQSSMVTGLDLLTANERTKLETLVRELSWIIDPLDDTSAPASLEERVEAIASARGKSTRTVYRLLKTYREKGTDGLVSGNLKRRRLIRTDQRWSEIAREVLANHVRDTTRSRKLLLEEINELFLWELGDSAELPSQRSQYRRLEECAKGAATFAGTKRRESVANSPKTEHGRLDITRPGQLVVLDSHRVDILVVMPGSRLHKDLVTRVEISVAQDYYTRAIVGVQVSPATDRVDVGHVIMQACTPMPAPEGTPIESSWRFHGIPQQISVPQGQVWGMPYVGPEAILTDRGKPYVSEHVVSVCEGLGISVYAAQPYKPTDKATLERFFRTANDSLFSRLPGYVGSDPTQRGLDVDKEQLLTIDQLDIVLRRWVCEVYHHNAQSRLTFPGLHQREMSPAEMYSASIAVHGLPQLLVRPDDWFKFLPKVARTIQHYGVQHDHRIYDGPALDAYRHRRSTEPRVNRAEKFRFAVDPQDIRKIYFQDPETNEIHILWWTEAHGLDAPFSDATMQMVRTIGAEDLPDRWHHEREFVDAALKAMGKDRKLRSRIYEDDSRLPSVLDKLAAADRAWAEAKPDDQRPAFEDAFEDDLDDPDADFDDVVLLAISEDSDESDDDWTGLGL
ncbi:hypothetical protein H483_0113605 [Dietzia sp. UCD-THP]|uniref:Mu transposase C-terminal domain-containing protein n=1 Tax=Dietzia sp. UCD-THP TaxID=1292020 RepID=UPI000369D6FC|nr:Mu transposase C-terminal domain-containing protein [Dietzia sp. UCD-THP]EYT60967.1 hypothetical protein H483_0113605 [Dietzia sp. UCD-THP]